MAVSLTAPSASRFTAARDPVDSLRGERRLAAAVLALALRDRDYRFLHSPDVLPWLRILGFEGEPGDARDKLIRAVSRIPRRGRPRKSGL